MKRFKNYAFWVALAGAIVIFLDDLKMLLGLDFDTAIVQSIILSFCGVLVVLGIVSKKNDDEVPSDLNDLDISTDADNEDEVIDNADNQKTDSDKDIK